MLDARRHLVGPGLALATLLCVGLLPRSPLSAQQRRTAGYAWDDPSWRFTHHDRQVKVVLMAGSIGAYRDHPYGRLLHQWCENAEIRNLSRVGQGAPRLFQRFRPEVLENPNVPIGAPGLELWLLFAGGLNSVGAPHRTNRAIRGMFELAHRRNVRVVALTLTPWGSEDADDERWEGARALRALRSTRAVVDFVMGRLTPAQALGRFARERRRAGPSAPWQDEERPDVAIDLYDSRLRDASAPTRPLEQMRRLLERDARWGRQVDDLSAEERGRRLEQDARTLAEAPRWFLRPEYRGFDHIHPNRAGHRVIAETACPQLPASWGCRCPSSGGSGDAR